jgi:hypothetical protein
MDILKIIVIRRDEKKFKNYHLMSYKTLDETPKIQILFLLPLPHLSSLLSLFLSPF